MFIKTEEHDSSEAVIKRISTEKKNTGIPGMYTTEGIFGTSGYCKMRVHPPVERR